MLQVLEHFRFMNHQQEILLHWGIGITDQDTGDLIKIANGEFLNTKIISIVKGQKGNPRKNSR